MSPLVRHIGVAVLLVLLSIPLHAQSMPPTSLRSALTWSFSSSRTFQDTTVRAAAVDSSDVRGSRSPALAVALSAVVPGAGQIYAKRYWTLPFVWGFGYWFIRQYRAADSKYVEWRSSYTDAVATSPPPGLTLTDIKRIRDFYRDERDRFAFYLAITYVLNIVDAYVGASLYNFDVGENLGATRNLQLRLNIPLR